MKKITQKSGMKKWRVNIMTDFQRDMEMLIDNGIIIPNGKKIRFVFRYPNRLKGGLEELGLNDRSYNCCRRSKINTIEDVTERWDTLSRMKGAGSKTVAEVKNKYVQFYYSTLDNADERAEFWRDTIKGTLEFKEE